MNGKTDARVARLHGLRRGLVTLVTISGLITGLVCMVHADQEVQFPDSNLEAAIREAIGQQDGPIMESKLASMMFLVANERGITELSGIEYCTALAYVYLAGNEIVDLGPLSELAKLQQLDVSQNQIVEVTPLGGLSQLKTLFLSDNQIVDIAPIALIEGLSQLYAANNLINDITPAAQMTSYGMLDLSGNQIADLSPLATGERYTWTDLDLSNNQIVDISALAGFDMLWRLYLSNNQITDVAPIAGLDGLLLLWLDGNLIEELPVLSSFFRDPAWRVPAFHDAYEVSCEYPHLNLANNVLQDLAGLEGNANLREGHFVDLSGNPFARGMRSPNALAILRLEVRGVTMCR